MLMTHEKINKLIIDLEKLTKSDDSFEKIVEQEKGILKQLRDSYNKYTEQFDIKLIQRINELKNDLALIEEYLDLKEEFQYCKTKDAADDVISSMILIYERLSNEVQLKRMQTDFRTIYHESNYNQLPFDKPINDKSFRGHPVCPRCSNKMILRSSFYGAFWGCTKFPMCWGKRNLS